MPRKRWRYELSIYDVRGTIEDNGGKVRIIESIDPNVPVPAPDSDLVRHALFDFDELAVMPGKVRDQLVADLVDAIRFWRGGVKARKRGISDKAVSAQIFLSDVAQALKRAGLPVKRWRKRYDDGDGPSPNAPESFFFRLAREVADVCGMALPQDLKLPGKRAAQHQYGVISPAMKAAQDVELATPRQGAGRGAPAPESAAVTRRLVTTNRQRRRKSG